MQVHLQCQCGSMLGPKFVFLQDWTILALGVPSLRPICFLFLVLADVIGPWSVDVDGRGRGRER